MNKVIISALKYLGGIKGVPIRLPEGMNLNNRLCEVAYDGKKRWEVISCVDSGVGSRKTLREYTSGGREFQCPVVVQGVVGKDGNWLGRIFVPENPESCVPTLSKDHKNRPEVTWRSQLYGKYVGALTDYSSRDVEVKGHFKELDDRMKHPVKEGKDYKIAGNWNQDLEWEYLRTELGRPSSRLLLRVLITAMVFMIALNALIVMSRSSDSNLG